MKILILLLLPWSLLAAEEEKAPLADFVVPVTQQIADAMSAALRASDARLEYYFQTQGIVVPEGAAITLDATKRVLITKLPHKEAEHLVQLLGAMMGENGQELIKYAFTPPSRNRRFCDE